MCDSAHGSVLSPNWYNENIPTEALTLKLAANQWESNNNKIPPKITNGKIFYSCFYPKMGQPMFRVFKRETIQKTLSLLVLLLFHYEPIPNQTGQMQMHKSPLLFLRLNNSVRISVQTNMVWLRTPSHPSTDGFKVIVWARGGVQLCSARSRFYQKSSLFLWPLHSALPFYMWKAHFVSRAI